MAAPLGCALMLVSLTIAAANAQQLDEYQVKAAFLYNFARFVEWPPDAFRNSSEPFRICVLGPDPFGRALDEFVDGKTIGSRPVLVRRISNLPPPGECNLLYVSSTAGKGILSALAASVMPGILTVGEANSPSSRSVIINFIPENGKIRFQINADIAARTRLHISSKLMNLAQAGTR